MVACPKISEENRQQITLEKFFLYIIIIINIKSICVGLMNAFAVPLLFYALMTFDVCMQEDCPMSQGQHETNTEKVVLVILRCMVQQADQQGWKHDPGTRHICSMISRK